MLKGGTLEFQMSDVPNQKFGTKKKSLPTSMEN